MVIFSDKNARASLVDYGKMKFAIMVSCSLVTDSMPIR